MDHSIVSVRYAKAFFLLAKERKILEKARNDMELVSKVCRESDEFRLLLESPVVKTSIKVNLISRIFKGEIEEKSLDFISMITKSRREIFIPGICRNFLDMVRKDQGIKTAIITSANTISHEIYERIRVILEKELGSVIEITGKVNQSIIGGLIVRIDDQQFDGSISTQLKKIKTKFLETEIK